VDPETDSKSVVLAKATLVMEVGTTPGLGVAEASNTTSGYPKLGYLGLSF
jgi:hypothetical protein